MKLMRDEPAIGSELLERNVFHKLEVELPAYMAKVEGFGPRMKQVELRLAALKEKVHSQGPS